MPDGRDLGMLVSPDDEDLFRWRWNLDKDGYARRSQTRRPLTPLTIFAHGLVAERMFGRKSNNSEVVDHINRNKLDNRRENLRMVNKSANRINSDSARSRGIGGLRYYDRYRSWHWAVKKNGKSYSSSSVCFGVALKKLQAKRREIGAT